MGFVALFGIAVFTSLDSAFSKLAQTAYSMSSSYLLAVIPLYMLMGEFAYNAGVTHDAYRVIYKWAGHLPGGLAMATIGGSAGFAAVCGSSSAAAVTMMSMAYPEMTKRNYASSLSLGSVAAGGTLGILISPSGAFVLYGLVTEQSIGKLFLSGIFPGILLTIVFMISIFIECKINPRLAPPGPASSWGEKFDSLRGIWSVSILFAVVMGGIYLGVFTVTEAAGVGVIIAFFLVIIRRRLTRRTIASAFMNTIRTTGMIFTIIVGAMLFNYFLVLSGLTIATANFITSLTLPPIGILCAILFLFVIFGCIMDSWAMLLILVPILYPVVLALDFDPIWFGCLTVIMVEFGLLTPPVGINVFIVAGMAKGVSIYSIYRGIVPFILSQVICVAILIAFPQIVLFLPYLGK
ncbi:TRAP transporter large permease, partial [Chloroflexota bacterium]